jgi:hypothetical protein
MRLEITERPSSWRLPWGYLLQLRDGLDDNTRLQESPSSATRQDIGQNTALHLACRQDPVHDVAGVDTGMITAPLCLCKVGQSPTPTLNRVKASWTSAICGGRRLTRPCDLSPLQDHFGEAQGKRPSSRWALITYLVLPDFLGKLYPSQSSMVGVDGPLHQPKRKDSSI